MGKKAGTIKAKKGSKTQDDKMKTETGQENAPAQAVPAAPNRRLGFLRLAKGGEKLEPEASKRVPAVPGKGKEPARGPARKEPGKPKPQFFQEAVKFLQSAWGELKKVHWPSRSELVVYTTVVIGSVVVVAVLIWIVDSILSQLLSHILS
jgi:preprotein translocase subunit SecE